MIGPLSNSKYKRLKLLRERLKQVQEEFPDVFHPADLMILKHENMMDVHLSELMRIVNVRMFEEMESAGLIKKP